MQETALSIKHQGKERDLTTRMNNLTEGLTLVVSVGFVVAMAAVGALTSCVCILRRRGSGPGSGSGSVPPEDPGIPSEDPGIPPEDPGISSVIEVFHSSSGFHGLLSIVLAVGLFFLVITAVKTLLCTNRFV
jgi:hypothetical protein